MYYSECFINSVKERYPNNKELHKALEDGDLIVGEYLKEGMETMVITVKKEDIIEKGSILIRDITKEFEHREMLYLRWKNFIEFNEKKS